MGNIYSWATFEYIDGGLCCLDNDSNCARDLAGSELTDPESRQQGFVTAAVSWNGIFLPVPNRRIPSLAILVILLELEMLMALVSPQSPCRSSSTQPAERQQHLPSSHQ